MNKEQDKWNKENPNGKAPLSWDLNDYEVLGEEAPDSLGVGLTEGESMEPDEVEGWAREEIQTLSVLRDEYPNKFEGQYRNFVLDLEYLRTLGKISEEELKNLKKLENFNFGRKEECV